MFLSAPPLAFYVVATMRTQLEENRQNAAKFQIAETKTNTNRGQRIEGGTAASIVKRERELQREQESLQVALRKRSKRRAALFCEGRDGGKGGRGGQGGEGHIYSQKDIF